MLIELRTACAAVCERCAEEGPPDTDAWGVRMHKAGPCRAEGLLRLADGEALQGRQVVATAEMRGECDEVCELLNGATLFREANGAGGYSYWSDHIGGGVLVWDTCLVSSFTLIETCVAENRRLEAKQRAKQEAEKEAGCRD